MSEHAYLKLLSNILEFGVPTDDRTGTGTLSTFGAQLRFNLADGFPLLTTKKVNFHAVKAELLWFLSGSTNVRDLQAMKVGIWDAWAGADGDLGPIYGSQWRHWPAPFSPVYTDQIAQVIDSLRTDPYSRRHLVSAWNVDQLRHMALPPCHYSFQFYVRNGRLSCLFNMRSSDAFLGLPFNIASYALLTHMVAQIVGLAPGELVYSGADVHIYKNHIEQVKLQLSRTPRPLPILRLNTRIRDINGFTLDDVAIEDYAPYPAIKGDVSV